MIMVGSRQAQHWSSSWVLYILMCWQQEWGGGWAWHELLKALPSDKPPTNWGSSIQMYEPTRTILIHNTASAMWHKMRSPEKTNVDALRRTVAFVCLAFMLFSSTDNRFPWFSLAPFCLCKTWWSHIWCLGEIQDWLIHFFHFLVTAIIGLGTSIWLRLFSNSQSWDFCRNIC